MHWHDLESYRFGIILRQTRTLLYNPSFQHLLLKLTGSKEEVAIAKEIQKAFEQSPPVHFSRNSNMSRVSLGPYPRQGQAQVCYSCGKQGHFAQSCWANHNCAVNRRRDVFLLSIKVFAFSCILGVTFSFVSLLFYLLDRVQKVRLVGLGPSPFLLFCF